MAEEKKLSVSEQGEVLQAFSRELDREVNTLIKRPDLLWQQLYNRLQWAQGPVTGLGINRAAPSSKHRC